MIKRLFYIVFYLLACKCHAQQLKDTLLLKTVEIADLKTEIFSTGYKLNEIDSITRMQSKSASLGELFVSENSLFIKSYGMGGIATTSFRGTEARHTSVLWNGFSINSPSLGLCDLALVPSSFIDKITIYHGASSSINGTSSLGGIIELKNEPEFKKGFELQFFTEAGSIGTLNSQLQINLGTENFQSSSKLLYENDRNNFKFINTAVAGSPEQIQKHATLLNYGIMQNFNFRLNPSSIISSGIWYQVSHRDIPPLMTSVENKAEQTDSVLRAFVTYQKTFYRSSLTVRSAYFDELQLYTDPVPEIYSLYKTKSYKAEIECRFYILQNLLINAGGSFNRYNSDFKEYNGTIIQNIYSTFTEAKYNLKNNFEVDCSVRKEFTEGSEPPLTPSAGFGKGFFNNRLILKLRTGKNFNLPTLNDLYWTPGGNPLLKPETAWSFETGVKGIFGKNKNFHIELTAYSLIADNWIQWQPNSFGYYMPYNLKKVHARGAEVEIKYEIKIGKTEFSFHGNYSYTRSTTIECTQALSKEIIGKQLIYIPEHLSAIKFSAVHNSFVFTYAHSFTGIRYTTSDNSSFLPFYSIADARIEKNMLFKKLSFNLFFVARNIFNEQYQVIAYRAMPGINFGFGTNIIFKTLKRN